MSRTYRHPLTQPRSTQLRSMHATTHKTEARICYNVVPEDVLACEDRGCNRPGILVLLPGIDASCAPCYCKEHMPQ